LLNRNEIANIVKAHLPETENVVVDKIVSDIMQDAENIIQSLIRQAVFQERDKQPE
jgi:(2Fe-2S) ferredoxin